MYKTIEIPSEYLSNILMKNEQIKTAAMQTEKLKAELNSAVLLAHADLGVSTKEYGLYTEENGQTHFVHIKEFEEVQIKKKQSETIPKQEETKVETEVETENITNNIN